MATSDRPNGPPDPRLCVMMFLEFFVWGAWYVSMTGYMGVAKIDSLIPWAYTVGPIAAIISPFFLGIVADRFFASQKVLGVMHLLGALAMLAVPAATASAGPAPVATFFHPFVLLLLAHMLCYMPTLGLSNTVCFHHMASPEKQFPVVRVFGTIGWIVGNIVVGGNLKQWGIDFTWIAEGASSPMQFYIAGAAGILLGLFSFVLPHTPPPAAGKKVTVREVLGLDSLKLMAQPSYFVFILCSFLICIPLAGYYNWAFRYVGATGFTNGAMTMSYGQMSEVVFMLLMPLFFARLGVKWMLAVAMLAWVVRYGLFSAAAPPASVAWMVVLGILLHGICYDFFFVAGFIYVDRKAPRELRGQAQGFLVLVTQGLGLGLGAQLFGYLVGHYTTKGADGTDVYDWGKIWMMPAIAAGVTLLVFVAAFRDDTAKETAGANA